MVARAVPLTARRASGPVVLLRGTVALVRRIRFDRVVATAALITAVVLVLVETPVAAGFHGLPLIPALALAVVHAGCLPLALLRPRTAALLALAAALALEALDTAHGEVWPWWPVLIVTQGLVLGVASARFGSVEVLVQWLLALAASALLAALLRPADGDATAVNLTVFGGVVGGLMGVLHLAAQWRRIRSELLRERAIAADESARRVVMEERTRIARELHDVIAHSMSIITVQSSTARFRHPEFDAAAVDEFERIGALSRRALDEMRGLLRVLRSDDGRPELHPQPEFADLPALVEEAARAGTDVAYRPIGGRTTELAELNGLAAYRIVQEALSNAIRHAPGAAVRITTEPRGTSLAVEIVNDPAPGRLAQPPRTPGHGMIGMAERAASVGGEVEAGPTEGGGWAVRALLPRGAPARADAR